MNFNSKRSPLISVGKGKSYQDFRFKSDLVFGWSLIVYPARAREMSHHGMNHHSGDQVTSCLDL